MAGEKVTIHLEGGSPWGFRLFGGEELPLVIAKLRKKSKAMAAGLQEDDVLLSINDRNCESMSHQTAMGLVESAGDSMDLVIVRGTSGGAVAASSTSPTSTPSPVPASATSPATSPPPAAQKKPSSPAAAASPEPEKAKAPSPKPATAATSSPEPVAASSPQPAVVLASSPVVEVDQEEEVSVVMALPQPAAEPASEPAAKRAAEPAEKPAEEPAAKKPAEEPAAKEPAAPEPAAPEATPVAASSPQPTAVVASSPQTTPVAASAPEPAPLIMSVQVEVSEEATSGIGGPSTVGSTVSVSQEQKSFQEGDTSTDITTETRTEKFGGTTVTKVTKQTEKSTTQNVPGQAPVPTFKVSNNKAGPGSRSKPIWVPGEPGGVRIQQNQDESVSMNIGFRGESKENIAPQQAPKPGFKAAGQSGQWKPKPGPLKPVQSQGPTPWQQKVPSPEPVRQQEAKMPAKWVPKFVDTDGTMSDGSSPDVRGHIDINKLIKHGSDSDEPSTPDSPSSWQTKKFYADSAFYDDAEGKFPTMAEQINMARKVAMSLTAPGNLEARGHKMFMKRKQKAKKWTSKGGKKEGIEVEEEEEPEIPYMKQDPWAQHGQAPPHQADTMDIPEPPPLPEVAKIFRAPVIPRKDQQSALSVEEFERMRMYEEKNIHATISPEKCFDLAQALKTAHGKSGKMFQKRKDRMEKYTVDESNVKHPKAPPPIAAMFPDHRHGEGEFGAPVQNRLKAMISIPKPNMSPWEAALASEGDNVEAAFDHLRQYEVAKIQALTPMPPAAPVHARDPRLGANMGPAVPPQGDNRAARGWGMTGAAHAQPEPPAQPVARGPIQPVMFDLGAGSVAAVPPNGWRPVSVNEPPKPLPKPTPPKPVVKVRQQQAVHQQITHHQPTGYPPSAGAAAPGAPGAPPPGTYGSQFQSARPTAGPDFRSPRPTGGVEFRSPRPTGGTEFRSPRPTTGSGGPEFRSPRPKPGSEYRSPRPTSGFQPGPGGPPQYEHQKLPWAPAPSQQQKAGFFPQEPLSGYASQNSQAGGQRQRPAQRFRPNQPTAVYMPGQGVTTVHNRSQQGFQVQGHQGFSSPGYCDV